MKRMIAFLASAAMMITALSVMIVPTSGVSAAPSTGDINLLTCGTYGPITDKSTVENQNGALSVEVTAGLDAQNNGHGLGIEPMLSNLDVRKDGGRGFLHIVMESDVPFRVMLLDNTGSSSKWISLGGEFFNVFVPEGFEGSLTMGEALYDGKGFMHAGKYDVYLYYGGIYEWKYAQEGDYNWNPQNAGITAVYFETYNPGKFTVSEMTLTSKDGSYDAGDSGWDDTTPTTGNGGTNVTAPTTDSYGDYNLLMNYAPNAGGIYSTVTETSDGLRVDVSQGVDSSNNGYGLALEPRLNGLVVDKDEPDSQGFIHLVMESDVPFRVTALDRDPYGYSNDKWIPFGGEFFNVFVPEGFEFEDPDVPTISEALYDGWEFMQPGRYDVYLYYGGVYTWKYWNGEYSWNPWDANLTGIYFEALYPGSFTIQEMTLTHSESSCAHGGGSYEPGTHTTAPVYIPITTPYGDTLPTTNVRPTAATNQYATTARYGHFCYTVSGNEATVTGYDGDDLSVTVPDKLGGKPVTAIGDYAFADNVRLQGIALPSTLKAIEYGAFENCISLESIDIPDSVTTIGYGAFENCWVLFEVDLPSSLREIGEWAFYNCMIGFLEIPDGVTHLPSYAFDGTLMAAIPGSVTSVDPNAFGYDGRYLQHLLFTGTKAQFKEIDQDLPLDYVTCHYGVTADVLTKTNEDAHCVDYGFAEWQCSVCASTHADMAYAGYSFIHPQGHVMAEDGRCQYCGTKDRVCLTSPHPYDTDILHRYKVVHPDAESVSVTFSDETLLEEDYDWLFVYDANGKLIDTYTGAELAGKTLTVSGDTVEMILQADTTDSEYGFEVTAVDAGGSDTLGDLNGDEELDMRDAFALYSATSGSSELTAAQEKVADMNGDGEVDMRDAFMLYVLVSGG